MNILSATLALAFALHAQDAQPLATVEQLQAKVAEQQKQIAEDEIELGMLRNGLGSCQVANIHLQAVMQAKQRPPEHSKPESK